LETVIAGVGSRGELPSPPFFSLSPSPSPSRPCTHPPFLPCARAPARGGARPCSPRRGLPLPFPRWRGLSALAPSRGSAAPPPCSLPRSGSAPGGGPRPQRGPPPCSLPRGGPAPGAVPCPPARCPLHAAFRPQAQLAWPRRGLALPRLPPTRSRVRNLTRAVIILGF
jgi:hypothetical protein